MTSGTVKWFDPVRGYGLIRPDDKSGDAFVHASVLAEAGICGLEGDRVTYEAFMASGKVRARSVKMIDEQTMGYRKAAAAKAGP